MGVSSTMPSMGSWQMAAAAAASRQQREIPSTVRSLSTSLTFTSQPASLRKLTRRMALMESPPMSKKLPPTPISSSLPKARFMASATARSLSLRGARYSTLPRREGSGKAL